MIITRKKILAGWLWTGAGLIFLMLVIGGITRLTGSGLSMTDWNLIMGALPPTSGSEWNEVFEQYKQFPEYKQLNAGMTLDEFKKIFFWEYFHRLLGRVIGIVFLIPFLGFWIRGYFDAALLKRLLILFGLGAMQGAMGWIMVKSGLIDNPYVSHYRLAAHLILAFVLIGLCAWFALDLRRSDNKKKRSDGFFIYRRWALAILFVFALQVFWGALTAGLHAGQIYNSFPLMNGSWIPRYALAMKPAVINFVENPGTVQWMHRVLGTLLLLLVFGLWYSTKSGKVDSSTSFRLDLVLGIIVLQYVLGILTLLFHVPVVLGVIHQAGAVAFWFGWLAYYHRLTEFHEG